MTTALEPSPLPPEPQELAVERAQRAWRRVGARLRSITPSQVARFALIAVAVWTLWQLFAGAWSDLLPFQLGLALAYVGFAIWASRKILP